MSHDVDSTVTNGRNNYPVKGSHMDLRRVDLNLLVILDQVLREEHVTRASVALSMSQPAVSNAMNRLRQLLGDPLLVRTGRSVQLTPFAQALQPRIRAVLAEIEHTLMARPTFDPTTDHRTFTLAATDYLTVVLLRSVIESLATKAPNVRIVVHPVKENYNAQLQEDQEDLIFLPSQYEVEIEGIPSEHLFFDHFVLALWRDHPRADADPAILLSDEPYLSWRTLGPSAFDENLRNLNIPLRKDLTTESLMTVPFLLSGTRLVTVIHERLAVMLGDTTSVITKPLPTEMPLVSQRMFWNPRRSEDAAHRWLRETVLDTAHAIDSSVAPARP